MRSRPNFAELELRTEWKRLMQESWMKAWTVLCLSSYCIASKGAPQIRTGCTAARDHQLLWDFFSFPFLSFHLPCPFLLLERCREGNHRLQNVLGLCRRNCFLCPFPCRLSLSLSAGRDWQAAAHSPQMLALPEPNHDEFCTCHRSDN